MKLGIQYFTRPFFITLVIVGILIILSDIKIASAQDEIERKVVRIVSLQLGVDKTKIKNELSFKKDLGADEYDLIELIMALEEEFEIDISDEDGKKITTIEQAINYIKEQYKINTSEK